MDPDPHYYVSGSETPLATSAYTVAMLDTYDILHCTYIYVLVHDTLLAYIQ